MRKWGFLLLTTMLALAALTACRDRSAQTGQTGQTGQTAQTTGTEGKSSQGASRLDTILILPMPKGEGILEESRVGFSKALSSRRY